MPHPHPPPRQRGVERRKGKNRTKNGPRISTTVLGTKATAARVDLAVKHEHLHRLFLLDVNVALVPFELDRQTSLLVWGGTNVAASGNGRHVGGARWSRVMRRPDVLGFAVRLLLATQVEDEAI